MIRGAAALLIAAVATLSVPARAEVVHSSETAFLIRHELIVPVPPEALWNILIRPEAWWQDAHTYSGSAANLSLDPVAGGCWCETLSDGGSIEHLRLIALMPHRLLRFTGALGPLQAYPVAGLMTFDVTPVEGGAGLTMTYAASGDVPIRLEAMAPAVDRVLGEQIAGLERAVGTAGGRR